MRQFLIIILCLAAAVLPAGAQGSEPADKARSGFQWTKIQDLNPNAPPSNSQVKQKWAIVIGAGRFKERRLNSSERPDEAALAFRQYLVDPHGGRFDEKHVKLLVNDEATQQAILSFAGPSWLGKLAGADDLVVIFIASGGFPTTDGNAYLLTYNCSLDNVYSTCLSMRTLMDTIRQNVHCNRIVLIVQAGYSGAAELESGAKALFHQYNLDPEQLSLGKGHVVLSSSQPDQVSWGNVFTNNLVASLREEDGLIQLERAFAHATSATEQQTSTTPGLKRQTPVMRSDWKGHDLVIGVPQIEQVREVTGAAQNFVGAEAHYLKANRLVESRQLDQAETEYKACISADPKYADALADYGAMLTLQTNWTAAAQKYKQAIDLRPNDALFHANYARVIYKLGAKDECRRELEKAYELDAKDRNVVAALSDRCLEAGDTDRACTLLVQAVATYPRAAGLHNRLSFALSRRGDIEAACSQAAEAVKLDPASQPARLNLGSLLLVQGDTAGAIKVYREAARLWTCNADVRLLLSRALEAGGDSEAARTELAEFVRLCPKSDVRLQSAQEHLQQMTGQ